VIGFSDTWYGIIASHLTRNCEAKLAIDAYDDYEAYMPWNKPLHGMWRRALASADLLTAAGPQLLSRMTSFNSTARTAIVEMRADPNGFVPMERDACRKRLELPLDQKLIGYCGSIARNRGISTLFEACELARKKLPDLKLVLCGRRERRLAIPRSTILLDWLKDREVPLLLNALDAVAVPNHSSSFSNSSYPVKLYEAMACERPLTATATESVAWILNKHPLSLVEPQDVSAFASSIVSSINEPRVDYGVKEGWEYSAGVLAEGLGAN
jgi:glycosyltransferase involved in cell wall biosynthesis